MRRTKEEAEVTRQKLLKAALAVFSRHGYADTRLEDIALEAGVTRGAIYHHFGSSEQNFNGKAELYNTLIRESLARINPLIQDAIEGGSSPLNSLKRLFVMTLEFVATDTEFRAITELTLFKTAITPELEQGIQQKIHGTHQMVDYIAALIEQGIHVGEIRSDVHARDVAIMLMGLQNGLLSLWLLDNTLFSLKERAVYIADIFAKGLSTT